MINGTKLSPLEEQLFKSWAMANGVQNQDDPNNQFDHRGLYKSSNGAIMPPGVITNMEAAHNKSMEPREGGDMTIPDPYMAQAEMHGNQLKADGDRAKLDHAFKLEDVKHQHKLELEQMKLNHKAQQAQVDRQQQMQADQQARQDAQMQAQQAREHQLQDGQIARQQQVEDSQRAEQTGLRDTLVKAHLSNSAAPGGASPGAQNAPQALAGQMGQAGATNPGMPQSAQPRPQMDGLQGALASRMGG